MSVQLLKMEGTDQNHLYKIDEKCFRGNINFQPHPPSSLRPRVKNYLRLIIFRNK